MSILDHVGLSVRDIERSKTFYTKALAPLGFGLVKDYGKACGFGPPGKPELWLAEGPTTYQRAEHLRDITPIHVALRAKDRAEVDAFYAAALAAGGKDHGAPGIRAEYHPHYYGAFIIDPDGHNIEAVIHNA